MQEGRRDRCADLKVGATKLNERSGNVYENKGRGFGVRQRNCRRGRLEGRTVACAQGPGRRGSREVGFERRQLRCRTPKCKERTGNVYESKGSQRRRPLWPPAGTPSKVTHPPLPRGSNRGFPPTGACSGPPVARRTMGSSIHIIETKRLTIET
jgi:hypothetical protein